VIVACGEALIDFVPARTVAGEPAYVARPGGSPFNVALGVGRLGVPAGFLGGMSTDPFGARLLETLVTSGVGTRYVIRTGAHTALAFVDVESAEPQYTFFDTGAAYRAWETVGTLDPAVRVLHFGSIALVAEPVGDRFRELMERERGQRILSIDPNIRPGMVGAAEAAYRRRLDAMFALADVVKISRADLDWLDPCSDPADRAKRWLAGGASLVVITAGADGSTGFTRDGSRVTIAAPPVEVVDTVGAGDSFMGALLAGLTMSEITTPAALAAIEPPTLSAILRFAAAAAAITCSRAGADPPWRHEVTLPGPADGRKEEIP
jgi:fructokinase